MNNLGVESFELNGEQIKTSVIDISNRKVIDEQILSFLRTANENRTKVIGFDTQWLLSEYTEYEGIYFRPRCATINLCNGCSCLVIQITSDDDNIRNNLRSFTSLLNFLSLPDYTFVGVGIKDNIAKLEKHYGFGCRNAVELGPLAASRYRYIPNLSFSGVDELAYEVNQFDLGEHRPLTTVSEWDRNPLDEELVKLATINVYSYYKIGSQLLERNVYPVNVNRRWVNSSTMIKL